MLDKKLTKFIIKLINGKEIAIETLARMIQKGFEETAKKEEMNQRFDGVENRLERIEKLLIADHH